MLLPAGISDREARSVVGVRQDGAGCRERNRVALILVITSDVVRPKRAPGWYIRKDTPHPVG